MQTVLVGYPVLGIPLLPKAHQWKHIVLGTNVCSMEWKPTMEAEQKRIRCVLMYYKKIGY